MPVHSKRRALPLAVATAMMGGYAFSADIVVNDIDVRGLQRISEGTVFTYLPVDVGETFSDADSGRLISSLYESGLFDDVKIGVDGQTLVVKVTERPSINEVTFSGNKDITSEQLEDALNKVKLAKGQVYNRSVLDRMERELKQQYLAGGKYNVKVNAEVTELDNNRVDIEMNISEGVVSKIKQVNIIGNEAFTDKYLMRDFNSGIPSWWAFISSKDDYSRPKLQGDLETLKSIYLDKGYLNFSIDSTDVTVTPDKRDIYIAIDIDEGDIYTVKDVNLKGDLVFPEAELRPLVGLEPGEIFSRAKLTATTTALEDKLGSEGYALSRVQLVPDVDEQSKTVGINYVIDPGERVYIRRISFIGNYKTRDEVFRREMRQLEGGWFSSTDIKRSKVRLQRLPYVESVDIRRVRVPGREDLMDLEVSVTERLSGSFTIGAGYSQNQGFLFNLGLSQANAFGTGNSLSLEFNNSSSNTVYSVSYTNPYYTVDGISRGFNAFYRTTDSAEESVASYLADRWGLGVSYGIPLTEYDRIGFNLGFQNLDIRETTSSPEEISQFLQDNGYEYDLFLLNTTFTHDTRDRTVFARAGNLQRFNLEATIPGSDLDYFKMSYRNQWIKPFAETSAFSLRGDLSYGEGYSETSDLPFFEKYYAGGINSVRGYDTNSLGPRTSTDDPFGGNFRVLGSAEYFFRAPFAKENPSVRMGLFLDGGYVFADTDDFDEKNLRTSAGLSFEWLSPVGPLTFSFAKTLNDEPDDDLQKFQFSIGGSF